MIRYTIGEMIDRLAITNLKFWHLEEEFAKPEVDLTTKGKLARQADDLNSFRNRLIAAIDEYFEEAQKGEYRP
jgi:hypothetical protein